MRPFIVRSIIRLVAGIIFLVLARAILLTLNTLGHYPERRLAGTFVSVIDSGTVTVAGWALAATIGILCLVAWEWLKLGNQLARLLPQARGELSSPATPPLAEPAKVGMTGPLNFRYWDQREQFAIWEAACLWVEKWPDLKTAAVDQSESYPAYKMLLEEVLSERTTPARREGEIFWWEISRRDLRKVAKRKSIRPLFLYSEDRSKKPEGLKLRFSDKTPHKWSERGGTYSLTGVEIINTLDRAAEHVHVSITERTPENSYVRPLPYYLVPKGRERANDYVIHPGKREIFVLSRAWTNGQGDYFINLMDPWDGDTTRHAEMMQPNDEWTLVVSVSSANAGGCQAKFIAKREPAAISISKAKR